MCALNMRSDASLTPSSISFMEKQKQDKEIGVIILVLEIK
jgi:hypothetical protein